MIIENGVLKKVENSDIKKGVITTHGIETIVELPEEVVEIGSNVFIGKEITTVIYSKNLKKIGNFAFSNSAISKMHQKGQNVEDGVVCLEKNIKEIGFDAFSNCKNIEIVAVDSKVIGQSAFEGCKNINIVHCGENVKVIANYAFKKCDHLRKFAMRNTEDVVLGRGIFTFDEDLNTKTLPEIFKKPYVNPNQNEHGEAQGPVENGHIDYKTAFECI